MGHIDELAGELSMRGPDDPSVIALREVMKRAKLCCDGTSSGTAGVNGCAGMAHNLSAAERQNLDPWVDFNLDDPGDIPLGGGESTTMSTEAYQEPWRPEYLRVVLGMEDDVKEFDSIVVTLEHGSFQRKWKGSAFMQVGAVGDGACCIAVKWPWASMVPCLGPGSTAKLTIEHKGSGAAKKLTSVSASLTVWQEESGTDCLEC